MNYNVGEKERFARIGIGAIASGLAIFGRVPSAAQIALGVLGLAGLSTGIARYCPMSQLIGYNGTSSRKLPQEKKSAA